MRPAGGINHRSTLICRLEVGQLTVNDWVHRVHRLVLLAAAAAALPSSSLPGSTGEFATAEIERRVRENGPS